MSRCHEGDSKRTRIRQKNPGASPDGTLGLGAGFGDRFPLLERSLWSPMGQLCGLERPCQYGALRSPKRRDRRFPAREDARKILPRFGVPSVTAAHVPAGQRQVQGKSALRSEFVVVSVFFSLSGARMRGRRGVDPGELASPVPSPAASDWPCRGGFVLVQPQPRYCRKILREPGPYESPNPGLTVAKTPCPVKAKRGVESLDLRSSFPGGTLRFQKNDPAGLVVFGAGHVVALRDSRAQRGVKGLVLRFLLESRRHPPWTARGARRQPHGRRRK